MCDRCAPPRPRFRLPAQIRLQRPAVIRGGAATAQFRHMRKLLRKEAFLERFGDSVLAWVIIILLSYTTLGMNPQVQSFGTAKT